jgi:hypothetical protein
MKTNTCTIRIPKSIVPLVNPIRSGPYVVLRLRIVGSEGDAVALPVEDIVVMVKEVAFHEVVV